MNPPDSTEGLAIRMAHVERDLEMVERQQGGEMRVTVRHDQRLEGHEQKINGISNSIDRLTEAIREQDEKRRTELSASLQAFDRECDRKVERLEVAIAEQGRKIDEQAVARKWTPTQWAAVLGPTLTALIGAAALVLTGGAP